MPYRKATIPGLGDKASLVIYLHGGSSKGDDYETQMQEPGVNAIDRGVADVNKVYIFGGSMGGTGTWDMLSNHPELFAAAMPVAGNPLGLNAEAVSKTPLFTVMGPADKIMKISNVETFLMDMDEYHAEYKFSIEDGWTHEDVCKNSYTNERLNWVFKHTKGAAMSIAGVTHDENKTVKVVWFSIGGQKSDHAPKRKGVYIKTSIYGDGSVSSEKYYVN